MLLRKSTGLSQRVWEAVGEGKRREMKRRENDVARVGNILDCGFRCGYLDDGTYHGGMGGGRPFSSRVGPQPQTNTSVTSGGGFLFLWARRYP